MMGGPKPRRAVFSPDWKVGLIYGSRVRPWECRVGNESGSVLDGGHEDARSHAGEYLRLV
jgi:hypothetical protein